MEIQPKANVRLNGTSHTLTTNEEAGLGRVCLAINSYDTGKYITNYRCRIHPSITPYLHSIKVPNSAELPDRENSAKVAHVNGLKLGVLVATNRQIKACYIDTKFSNDGKELDAAVANFVDGALEFRDSPQVRKNHADYEGILPPRYFSILVSHQTDPAELRTAASHALLGENVVAVVGTSKKPVEMYERYGLDQRRLTAVMARMAMDAGITNLFTAAGDAEMLRDELSGHELYEKLCIFGTGAVLDLENKGDHDRVSLVSEVKHSVNVFVLGEPVLLHNTPDISLLNFAREIGF